MNAREELHDIVRQLKTELEWAGRTGIVVEERRIESKPQATKSASVGRNPKTASSAADGVTVAQVREDLGDGTRSRREQGQPHIVFGVGNKNAELMFVGEDLGASENQNGELLAGPAGQLLTKIIVAMGFAGDDVYIANIVKGRLSKGRDLKPEEIEDCLGFLRGRISESRPKVIVCLGGLASQILLQTNTSISKFRGQWKSFDGIDLIPTFHPSYLLRSPANKRPVWEDMQAVVKKLGRELPKRA